MAKKNPAAVAVPEGEVITSADGTTAEAPKKVKKERLFQSNLNLQDIRKAESKVAAKFNRIGRGVKALGMTEASQNAILEILKKEFELKSSAVFSTLPPAVAAEPAVESFV